jgi:transposase
VNKHLVHLSGKVKRWVEKHADRIRLFLLPPYSPELNPDELLNHEVKESAGRKRPHTRHEMIALVRQHLQHRQHQSHLVQRFFLEKHVAYAAA